MSVASCDNVEYMNGVASIFTALATILLAVVAQIYSARDKMAREVDEKRRALREACDDIDYQPVVQLFQNKFVNDAEGKPQRVDWNALWNPNTDYTGKSELAGRMLFTEFMDSLRAASHAFLMATPTRKGNNVWSGVYDIKTKKLRLAAKPFRQFYMLTYDGIVENRRTFVQKVVGNEKDWNMIIQSLMVFDDELHPADFPWLLNKNESTVSIKDGDDEEEK